MKINNMSIEKFTDTKVKLNEQYEAEKKIEWEKDREYVTRTVANKLAFAMKQVEQIAESISDRRVASRLVAKFFERNMEFHIHKEFTTKWINNPDGVHPEGRYLKDFDINRARDGIHFFGQVRFSKAKDRVIDFVLVSKKNDYVKKFAIECQTNLGHSTPRENHVDCVLAREITLDTDFIFLPHSSREIFFDSNISSLDRLVDELEFGDKNKSFKESDAPF